MADPRKPNGGLDDVARRVASTRRRVRQLESPDGAQLNQVVQRVYTAQSTADTATTKADTAQSTADSAQTTASGALGVAQGASYDASNANTAAQTAQQQAQAAQTAVAAKTKTTWSTATPSNTANPGTADGDQWFVTVSTGGAAKAQYRWTASSSSWVLTPIDGAALQNVVADSVKAGVLDGITVNGVTVNGGVFRTAKDPNDSTQRSAEMRTYGITTYVNNQISGNQAYGGIASYATSQDNYLLVSFTPADAGSINGGYVYIGGREYPGGSVTPSITSYGYWDVAALGGKFSYASIDQVYTSSIKSPPSNSSVRDRIEVLKYTSGTWAMNLNGGTATAGTVKSAAYQDVNGNNLMPLTGNTSYSGTLGAQSSDTQTVTFPSGRFSVAPTVNANGSNSRVTIGISSVSATSVTFALGNWTSTAVASLRIYWTATPNQ